MVGNVWEWMADWYDENYYAESPERNPKGPSNGQYRVLRGGAWLNLSLAVMRAANRDWNTPENRNDDTGFRCARDAFP
jgi:formylglycine-generating enzyme required for sulfatase activity